MRSFRPRSLFRLLYAAFAVAGSLPAFGNVAPEFTQQGFAPKLKSGGAAQALDLRTLFRDPDALGSAVRVNVRLGSTIKPVDIVLFDQEKPITVTNFLAYVNSGRHSSNFFHRSVPGFVVQGGGFAWNPAGGVDAVPTYAKIQNEPGISNLRGTVAMAKLGGDPNSATSQWFVNLADNSANLDAQNGGFTVFGRVVGNGMAVIDEVAALPIYNAGSPFDSLPLKDFPGNTNITRVYTVETNSSVIPTLNFTASSSDPSLVGVSVTGSTLQLTPAAGHSGSATVTLSATDLDGATVTQEITVTVLGWQLQPGADNQPASFTLKSTPADTLSQSPVSVQMGSVNYGDSVSRSFAITNNTTSPLTGLTSATVGGNAGDFLITSGGGPVNLAAGETATVTVTFKPTSSGSRSTVLHLASTDSTLPPLDLALSGVGVDTTPPVVSPVAPQVLTADATRTAVVPDWRASLVTATDNVGVTAVTQSPAPGTKEPFGEYALTFTARDLAGNATTVQSTVSVGYDPATQPQVNVSAASAGAAVPVEGSTGLPDGSTLSAFGTPAIDDHRNVAARVTIAAGNSRLAGIYWESAAGAGRLVARQNQASGVVSATFKSFRDPLLAPGGAIAFAATLNGVKATEDGGVWTDLFGTLQPVLREGADVPGLAGLKLKSVTSVSLADDALLALVKLLPSKGVVTAASDTALVRITGPNAGTLLVRTGTEFDGSTIKQISALQPAARSAGQGRWSHAGDTVAKLTLADRRKVVVQLKSDGTKFALLQAGAADPKLATPLANLSLPALGGPGVAVLANKALQPGINATNDSVLLYAADGVNFSETAHEEPGAAKFASFSDPVANDQGAVLFYGTLRAETRGLPNVTALWLTDGATAPEMVAQLGTAPVDREGHPLADTSWSAITSFALPDGPGAGPVFIAQLSGKAVTAQKKLGLWAADSVGYVRLLLRTGDDVTTPAGTKRVTGFTLLNALPGSFGARRSYNAAGGLAVQATFSDRTQAILRIDVP